MACKINLNDFEAFVFDLDGTLLDSGKYHARAFAHAVQEQSGYMLTSSEHDEFFASHSIPFTKVLNKRYGLSMDPEQVLEEKRRRMEEIFVMELFDGARDFLEHWHAVKPLALATNSPAAFTVPALEDTGIKHYFSLIITADDVTSRKPDPEIFERTAQRLNLEPDRIVVFEDQIMGVEAARRAGLHTIAVDNGQKVDFPADVYVTTWRELLTE